MGGHFMHSHRIRTAARLATLALAAGAYALLTACSSADDELARFVEDTKKEPGGRVEPLPEIDRAIVYRMRADTWDGVADINNPIAAKLNLQEFDQVWNASAAEYGLRAARRG